MSSIFDKIFGESDTMELSSENQLLRTRQFKQVEYIRRKTNQLLVMMGTLPIRPEELDDDTLIEIDPIGTVTDSFSQILEHQKELNERLRIAHDEIQAILSSVGVGMLVLDSSMRIQMFNQKVIELFSIDAQNLIGRTCCQAICGTSTLPDNCTFERVLETKRAIHQTDWIQAGCHFDVVGTPVKNRFGDITHVVLSYTDITNRVETERRLRDREQMYLDVLENARDIVQCIVPDGSFLYVNRSWRETLGYSPDEIAGLKIWNIIAPEHRNECLELFNSLLHGRHPEQIQTVFFSKEGKEIPVEGHVSCSLSKGKPVATFGMFRVREINKGISPAQ